MTDQVSTLIVSPPGRFRDSLRVLLRAVNQISLVGQADTAASGLKMMGSKRPYLVLLDASLPDGHAWDVLKQVKREWPSVCCLVLTHTQKQQHIAQNIGADKILMDGFTTESLYNALRVLIDETTSRQVRNASPSNR